MNGRNVSRAATESLERYDVRQVFTRLENGGSFCDRERRLLISTSDPVPSDVTTACNAPRDLARTEGGTNFRRQEAPRPRTFSGHSAPSLYSRYMGPLAVRAYAKRVAEGLVVVRPNRILETAAGTGIVMSCREYGCCPQHTSWLPTSIRRRRVRLAVSPLRAVPFRRAASTARAAGVTQALRPWRRPLRLEHWPTAVLTFSGRPCVPTAAFRASKGCGAVVPQPFRDREHALHG